MIPCNDCMGSAACCQFGLWVKVICWAEHFRFLSETFLFLSPLPGGRDLFPLWSLVRWLKHIRATGLSQDTGYPENLRFLRESPQDLQGENARIFRENPQNFRGKPQNLEGKIPRSESKNPKILRLKPQDFQGKPQDIKGKTPKILRGKPQDFYGNTPRFVYPSSWLWAGIFHSMA